VSLPLDDSRSDSPTELVYIINSLHVGGAEVGMCRLLSGLDEDLYDVTVVSLSGSSPEILERLPSWVKIVELQIRERPSVTGLRRLWSCIRQADVIVGSLFHAVVVARIGGSLNYDATVATWDHSEHFNSDYRKTILGKSAFLSDVILADSEAVAETLRETFDFNESCIEVVPIAGIDLDDFEPVAHTNSNPTVVGSVGRITKAKNYNTLLDVARRFDDDEFQFKVAGDGELLDELQTRVQEQGISNVTFLGEITNVPDFLASLDVYFQPSLDEGLCITVLEAMSAGLPVVGSNVGGIAHNIQHGENGFLYEPDDIEGFVDGIETLAADVEMRERFGKRGRNVVAEKYTQEVLVSEFEKAVLN
jgi:glycosyltransferase involved in cell wall biosynthesis